VTHSPPTGTVTFLFTDIEGSTKLAQQVTGQWAGLLARHHAILSAAIESQNGCTFQIIGDAFCSAFHTAGDALQAALKAQLDLQAEPWGQTPIRVRMGIHTGRAEIQTDGSYSGYVTLCRVQRIMSAGHGGQTLVSQAARDLLGDELLQGISLRDLGEQRLKDLTRPERIYQLLVPGLRTDFPALKTLELHSNNLPIALTSFIGREREMEEIKELTNGNRLITITGPGGTGKTRLALQTAADLLDAFPAGVWLVELAQLSNPALVPQAVASALGMRESPGLSLQSILTDFLREKKLLLILDNCEHLVEACAQLASALLRACPQVTLLGSSRESLGIAGEVVYRVPPLSLPGISLTSAESLVQF
jgi:class 3 adenylate cyclase